MKPRTFVFVAAQTAFGEAVLGLRIAHELHARGDRIVVLAGELLSVLTKGTPFRAVAVTNEEYKKGVAKVIARAVADVHADAACAPRRDARVLAAHGAANRTPRSCVRWASPSSAWMCGTRGRQG